RSAEEAPTVVRGRAGGSPLRIPRWACWIGLVARTPAAVSAPNSGSDSPGESRHDFASATLEDTRSSQLPSRTKVPDTFASSTFPVLTCPLPRATFPFLVLFPALGAAHGTIPGG